jgi:hypothetical protein
MGDSVVLLKPDQQWVIATGIISRIGGQGCAHHGTLVVIRWFWVQLDEILEGSKDIPLFVTNENDDVLTLALGS